jgi:hypothetical protein
MTALRNACLIGAFTLVVAPSVVAQVPVGDFYFFDRSEGEVRQVSVTTLAEENPVKGAGGLTWACEGDEGRLIVSSTYLGRAMRARVRWAFDGEAFGDTESWILRRTGMAVIAPPEIAAEFTRRALGAARVTVQVTDYQFRRESYTFNLEGVDEALGMLPCAFQSGDD